MTVATWLLFGLGILGAVDILLYHSISHGIRENPDSRAELLVHALRGPTYATLFLVVPNLELHGAWFYGLLFLLAFDFLVSVWDFALEGESRRFLGGLPSGEYVLHMIIAMVFGAMVAAVAFEAGHWAELPTAWFYRPADVPELLRAVLAVMAVGVLVSGLQDALAAARLKGQPRRGVR